MTIIKKDLIFFYIPNFLVSLSAIIILFFLSLKLKQKIFKLKNTKKYILNNGFLKNVFVLSIVLIFILNIFFNNSLTNITSVFLYYSLIFLAILAGSILILKKPNFNELDDTYKQYSHKKIFYSSFILITIIFILLKLLLPLFNTSSYVDEYFHILSGISFFQTKHFAFFTSDFKDYSRGEYVSFFVGLLFLIFKKSLYVAKLLPAIIGILNYFLLYKISKSFLNNKFYIILLLILYTISPWVIFNHFFIRFFVFYELFFLALIYSFTLIINNLSNRKYYFIGWAILLLVNTINWFFSNDNGKYFILLTTLVFLIYFFIKIFKVRSENKIINLLNNSSFKLLCISAGSFIMFFLLNIPEKISMINDGILKFGSSNQQFNYYSFFLNFNPILTILFIILFFNFYVLKKDLEKIIILIISSILLLLFSFNIQIQAVRIILFLLPIFYLSACISLERINYFLNKKEIILILILILSSLILNYPKSFFKQIGLKNEVVMHKYDEVGKFLSTSCKNKHIYILNHEPQIFYLYLKDNYSIFYVQTDMLLDDSRFYLDKNKQFNLVFENIKVINNPQEIKKIINIKNNCIAMNDNFENNWRYIEKNEFLKIQNSYKYNDFGEYKVYSN